MRLLITTIALGLFSSGLHADAGSKQDEKAQTPLKTQALTAQLARLKDKPENTKAVLAQLPRAVRFEALQQVLKKNIQPGQVAEITLAGERVQVDAAAVIEQGKADGTYSTFGAVFDVSGVFGDAGNGSVPAAQTSIQTTPQGVISFESRHYGAIRDKNGPHHPDFSFGGTIGIQPTLVLENLSSTTATVAQPNARPMFQDAFRWTLGPDFNIPIYDHGEAGLFVDLGQTFLVSQVTSFKQGNDAIVATPVNNNVGRAAFFWETGAQLRLLNVAIIQAHTDLQSFLLPEFKIAAGYRHDSRFNRQGDLAAFPRPEDRYFFRFFISLNNILDQRPTGKANQPMSFKFGVEYERPVSGNMIPSATRYIVSADIDILKLFRPPSPDPGQGGSNP